MTEQVRTEMTNGVLTLTLARADKKNALTDAMYGMLADTIEGAETNSSVRVLLICGEGDMFTAGNDVGEFAAVRGQPQRSGSSSRWRAAPARWSRPSRAVRSASAPRCYCIAISLCSPTMRCCRRRSSASHWCRRRPRAC
jgi:enoyl-CoA hydratase/carnithine racemase